MFVLLQLNALHIQEIPGEEPVGELPQLTKEELKEVDIRDLQYKVSLLEDKLRASHPNLSVIQEYKQKVISELWQFWSRHVAIKSCDKLVLTLIRGAFKF